MKDQETIRNPFRAVIFDLDGVLWDGEPLYHEAFNLVLARYGHQLNDEDYTQIMGHAVDACWQWVRERFGLTESLSDLLIAYDNAVVDLMRRPAEPLPGVRALLDELTRRGFPLAVASASLRPWVDTTLAGLGLRPLFQAVVSASEVDNGKPAPDLYLAAARLLRVSPGKCLAFEDTAAGVAAAKAAGMSVVQVRVASTALSLLPNADMVIENYSQFDLSLLDGQPVQATKPGSATIETAVPSSLNSPSTGPVKP